MADVNVKIDLGHINIESLDTEDAIRAAAKRLVPNLLKGIGESGAEVMWKQLQKAFSGPGIKANNSASEKRKFIENAGKEYARKASAKEKSDLEDHIVAQIRAQRKK